MRIQAALVLLAIAVQLCAAETVKERYAFAGEKKCTANGQLEFGVTQFKGNIFTKDIKGIGLKRGSNNYYERINGTWYDEDYRQTQVIRTAEKAIFVSKEAVFDQEGNYTIILANRNISENRLLQINYYTGKNILDDGNSLYFTVECPGFKYNCEKTDLQIKCDNNKSTFTFEIFGLADGIDAIKDIGYTFYSGQSKQSNKFPDNATIKTTGQDSLTFTKDMQANEITSVLAIVKDCNPKIHKTRAYKICQKEQSEQSATEEHNSTATEASQETGSTEQQPAEETNTQETIPKEADKTEEESPAIQESARPGIFTRVWAFITGIFR